MKRHNSKMTRSEQINAEIWHTLSGTAVNADAVDCLSGHRPEAVEA